MTVGSDGAESGAEAGAARDRGTTAEPGRETVPGGPPVVAMMMAMDRNRLIGQDGHLPWHVPGELAYFKSVTLGKPVLMGRRTFESIGRPLPGRTNVVVTRNPEWRAEGVEVARSFDEALATGRRVAGEADTRAGEVVVIGGAGLCADAMPATERLYLTVIDHAFEGDTWLDSYDAGDWREVSCERRDPATTGGLDVRYLVLERLGSRLDAARG